MYWYSIMWYCWHLRHILGPEIITWLRECCRQVEAEVVSNSRNQFHQTTYKYYFRAQYRDRLKSMKSLLSRTQAGRGRAVKQQQEPISPNHVQAIFSGSVHTHIKYSTYLFVFMALVNSRELQLWCLRCNLRRKRLTTHYLTLSVVTGFISSPIGDMGRSWAQMGRDRST